MAERRSLSYSAPADDQGPEPGETDRPGTDRPGTDRPATDRPATDRPGTGPAHAAADESRQLHDALASLPSLAGTATPRPVIGVLDPSTTETGAAESAALAALRMAATLVELRRRLAGFEVQAYTLAPVPTVSELADDRAQSLAPWGPDSAVELSQEVDALVVLPRAGAAHPVAVSDQADAAVAELAEAGVPVHRLTADEEHPDPLVLAGRLADGLLLRRRREYLAVTGQVHASAPYVLCLASPSAGADLDERVGPARVVVRPEQRLVPVDLMALVASAEYVVTSSPEVRALALGLGRPVVPGVAELDSTGRPACDPVKQADRLQVLLSRADRTFDDLYGRLVEDAGSKLEAGVLDRLAWLERRVAALEAVNTGLRETLARERSVMAAEIGRPDRGGAESTTPWSTFNVDRMTRDLAAAQVHMARLQGEIDAIYATRTMRTLAPVRRLYGLARRIIPRSP